MADNTPISDLQLPEDAWISFIIRGGRLVPAHTGTVLHAGDEVVVLATPDEASLRSLFGPKLGVSPNNRFRSGLS